MSLSAANALAQEHYRNDALNATIDEYRGGVEYSVLGGAPAASLDVRRAFES